MTTLSPNPKEVWVVKGETSGNVEGQPAGLTEWQFSDGPTGNRGYSEDYTDLAKGLAEHSGCIVHWDTDNDEPEAGSPPVLSHNPFIFDGEIVDNESCMPLKLACVKQATDDDVAKVLALPKNDDGRSEWHWVRLRDGTLMLAMFPQGDSYMQFSDAGVCDFE